jgi:hypothetical protein
MTHELQPAPLLNWIRERERIRICKERRDPPPWTDDPILAKYRFCCVRREDDRGTIWIRQNIREPYADHPMLWLMLCIARQINWPDTLEELIAQDAWPGAGWIRAGRRYIATPNEDDDFDPRQVATVLNARKERGDKIYTGAYMISAPATKGADKQSYIANAVIGDLWRRRGTLPILDEELTLQKMHEWISASNGWGPFMAYQAVVDMRFTRLLESAPDRETWAAAGPGTIRGLNRLHGRPVDAALPQTNALIEMRRIYEIARSETVVEMDFSDVPNVLCETDKYLRVMLGQGAPRARYVPGRGS